MLGIVGEVLIGRVHLLGFMIIGHKMRAILKFKQLRHEKFYQIL